MKSTSRKKLPLIWLCALYSLFVLLAFHAPFFNLVLHNTSGGINAFVIPASLALLMLAVNFFATYLLLYAGRIVGKAILSLSLLGNAISLYFINTYDVLVDDTMMGNVFNTSYGEATSYWSGTAALYLLLLFVLPSVLLFLIRLDYGSVRKFFASIGVSLALMLGVAFGNMSNWPWIDHNATQLGSLILPWSYSVNAIRYQNQQRQMSKEEILLPDATFADSDKEAVVLVIGESARRDHFSLYGYSRDTNPLLEKVEGLKTYPAVSAATYTTAGVKAILDHKAVSDLYEILPNYLHRSGAYVSWRTSNWGQSTLNVDAYYTESDLGQACGRTDSGHDDILLTKLKEEILGCGNNKVLVVIHTSISHGPQYALKYTEPFNVFTPVSTTVEMASCDPQELINGYDNSILYTDWILSQIISFLQDIGGEGWRSCMMFVSDHGESLGENNLYMHGVPISIAPREQYEIPFIVWTSDGAAQPYKDIDMASQYHVFHSVAGFLGLDSPVYNPEMDIFRP